jgi:hypothetical protein
LDFCFITQEIHETDLGRKGFVAAGGAAVVTRMSAPFDANPSASSARIADTSAFLSLKPADRLGGRAVRQPANGRPPREPGKRMRAPGCSYIAAVAASPTPAFQAIRFFSSLA